MVTAGYLPFHPNPRKPDIVLPAHACDSHCHVFGPVDKFPFSKTSSYIPVDAPVETLVKLHDHLGLARAIIVQASCHGTDNSAMLDALVRYPERYRGVAIVASDITADELSQMHKKGVRGVRFNFVKRLKAKQTLEERKAIVEKIQPLGWHIIIYLEPDDMDEVEAFLDGITIPVIFDHMARVPVEKGIQSAEFTRVQRLLENNKDYWIKVSCPERLSKKGPPYDDVDEVAKKLIEIVPDRVLWGTDWPHPNMKSHAPDDGLLVDRLGVICENSAVMEKLLITNPDRLYWTV
ncbi:MAG: 2-pyrone-4,6-dicarboxylate hydrolase [Hyphomicrobiales bacterium]|nr:MAG: 2-pyrone-4,6-dicarboxylate hydrolase [Hyphomicrobiales bacterium]